MREREREREEREREVVRTLQTQSTLDELGETTFRLVLER